MKNICLEEELMQKALSAAEKLFKIVGSTLGPSGRTVLLQGQNQQSFGTKDGVTIAKFIDFEDPIENAIAQILKQSAIATNTSCGDGTTTAIILTYAIFFSAIEILKQDKTGYITITSLKKSIEQAIQIAIKFINNRTKIISSLEEIQNIALISSNGDNVVANLIAEAVDAVGKDGAIAIEESHSFNTILSLIDGFKFGSGYLSNSFVTDVRKGAVVYNNPYVLITDQTIASVQELMPVLELVARNEKPLVIIGDIREQALAALIINSSRGTLKVAGVDLPAYGEERRSILDDLSLFLGGKYFRREMGDNLTNISLSDFGRAKKIEITKNNTIVVNGGGEKNKIIERIEILKKELKEEKDEQIAKIVQQRITRLSSNAAIIKIGGLTEAETIEKLHRVQDALEAVRSAIDGGIVAGGGTTQLAIAKDLEKELETNFKLDKPSNKIGIKIISKALEWPFYKLVQNAKQEDVDAKDFQNKFYNNGCKGGLDFSEWKWIDDMFAEGIIDPAKVVATSLMNAGSAACALLMMSGAVVEIEEERDEKKKKINTIY